MNARFAGPTKLRSPASSTNFDRVARLYRWAEYMFLGPLLNRTRDHFLPQLTPAKHALVLGDGDGRFLAKLLRQAPQLQATAVDTSATMLHLLGQRCSFATNRLTTVQSSALDLPGKLDLSGTDLIVTHFFLDCLHQPELEALSATLAGLVAPGCLWVVSDFAVPPRQPWRTLGRLYIGALYRAFRVLTNLRSQELPFVTDALHKARFRRIYRSQRLAGLLYSELWRLGPGSTPWSQRQVAPDHPPYRESSREQ